MDQVPTPDLRPRDVCVRRARRAGTIEDDSHLAVGNLETGLRQVTAKRELHGTIDDPPVADPSYACGPMNDRLWCNVGRHGLDHCIQRGQVVRFAVEHCAEIARVVKAANDLTHAVFVNLDD